jgi:hypothetical protein
MPIYVSGKKKFTPAPEGLWPGICVDVVDLGMVESSKYEPRHMVQIRWVLDAEPALESGKPHMAMRQFGNSLGKKSHLRPFLEAWRGRKFTNEELELFDLETLIGACGQIQIIHATHDGETYGNVQAVVPYPRGMSKMTVPTDYVRQVDREKREEYEKHPDGNGNRSDEYEAPYPSTDEDIPF